MFFPVVNVYLVANLEWHVTHFTEAWGFIALSN